MFYFFFYCHGDHRDLHSFPTRRSSDLSPRCASMTTVRLWQACINAGSYPSCFMPRITPSSCHGVVELPGKKKCQEMLTDRKSTRLNSSHVSISYAVFCLKKKKKNQYIS